MVKQVVAVVAGSLLVVAACVMVPALVLAGVGVGLVYVGAFVIDDAGDA